MASHWLLIIQAASVGASVLVGVAAIVVALRSSRAQERATAIADSLLRIEKTRELQDQARLTLHMQNRPWDDRTVLKKSARHSLAFRIENSGNRGSDIRRIGLEIEREDGTVYKPRAKLKRGDPGFEHTDHFIEAGRLARIDVTPETDDLPDALRLAECRVRVHVIPVRGEAARSEWGPTLGSEKWIRTI